MTSFEKYASMHPTSEPILREFFKGKAPSEIDSEMNLTRGRAHDELIAFLAYDKAICEGKVFLMRCPFRMAAFDQPDACDHECAWLVVDRRTLEYACAVAVVGSAYVDVAAVNCEPCQEEKPVGALGRYARKEGQ